MGECIKRHLTYAGAAHGIFSDAAAEEIYQFANGAPRLVNRPCTRCMLYGAQNDQRIIDDHMVKSQIACRDNAPDDYETINKKCRDLSDLCL